LVQPTLRDLIEAVILQPSGVSGSSRPTYASPPSRDGERNNRDALTDEISLA
jgi:hypothetical protein